MYRRGTEDYFIGSAWVPDATGTKRRRAVGGKTYEIAEAKLEALIAGERLPGNLAELHAVKDEAWHEGKQAPPDAVSPYWRAQK